jgi:polyhydroxyalkanoate synthase
MQAYLALCTSLDAAVQAADIDWRDKERARFIVSVLTSTAAPTNTLVGNPAAIKRAVDSGGLSLARGTRNFVKDLRSDRGMPSTVNRAALAVGTDLTATPGAVIYRDEVCELLQYAPSTSMVRSRPVLMVPPQISKYYFMDLSPGRSFVEHAVAQRLRFFVISWRNVTAAQPEWGLEHYAAAIGRVVDVVAPLLALFRERSSRTGVLDSASLSAVFSWMRPNDLVWNCWGNNYLMGNDPPVFDILAWNADPTNLAGQLHGDVAEQRDEIVGSLVVGLELDGGPYYIAAVRRPGGRRDPRRGLAPGAQS